MGTFNHEEDKVYLSHRQHGEGIFFEYFQSCYEQKPVGVFQSAEPYAKMGQTK